jgi:glutathione synthase/RimK-type ligase-like ATP-grasp enzyme
MKLWIITNEPPVSGDTAYMVGRVLSHCSQVFVTPVTENEESIPEPPGPIDGILNRSFCINPRFLDKMDALAASLGVRFINPGAATMLACDKRSSPEMYPGKVPETWIVSSMEALSELRDKADQTLVLKGPFGKRGEEVIRFRGEEDLLQAQALLKNAPEGGIVAQRFCHGFIEGDKRIILHRRRAIGAEAGGVEAGGFDIAAWYKRIPAEGGWLSNVSAGGRAVPCDLERDEKDLAMEVAEIAGLDYIGIDIGRDQGRCLLIETNGYTGGHIDFDVTNPGARSGDDFARMVSWMCRDR